MEKKDLQSRFSCKRKRDYVTYAAVFLFGVMLCFQIYLIVILPIQLKKAETLEHHVLREQLLLEMDRTRIIFGDAELTAYMTKNGHLREQEFYATKRLFEKLLVFTRANSDHFSISQLNELMRQHFQIRGAIMSWQPFQMDISGKRILDGEGNPIMKKGQFSFREETLDREKYVKMLNDRLNKEPAN